MGLVRGWLFEVHISISFFRNPSKCDNKRGRVKGRKKKQGRKRRRKKEKDHTT